MQEHSPSSGAEQTPPKPPNNPPQPPQIDYQLIPAEVVEGEVVVDPKASPPLTEERRIYVAYRRQQTLVNTKVSSVNYSGGLPPPEFLELAEKYHPGVTKEIFVGYFIRLTRAKREDLDKIPEPKPSQSTSTAPKPTPPRSKKRKPAR